MRQLKNWLETYCEYHLIGETAPDFHTWSGLSILSALTERKIWMDRGIYTLFLNLYICLVAESAVCRKSQAVRNVTTFLKQLEHPISPAGDSITMPALLSFLANEGGAVILTLSELETFLGDVYKTGLHPVLTHIYDCPDDTKIRTVSRGGETLRDVFINILGATTPKDLVRSVPADKAGGGLPARFIFIHREEPNEPNLFPEVSAHNFQNYQKLLSDAAEIRELQGAIGLDDKAKEIAEKWYKKHWTKVKSKVMGSVMQGYIARKHDTLFKIAGLLSLAYSDSLIITEHDINYAIELLEANETTLFVTHRLLEAREKGLDCVLVENIIKKAGYIGHSKLLSMINHKMSGADLAIIIDTLYGSGSINIDIGLGGKKYTWKRREQAK